MNKLLIAVISFLIGMTFTQVPDFIHLYSDHVIHVYQKRECAALSKSKNNCYFEDFFPIYKKENSTLEELTSYFQGNEGILYYVASGKCTNSVFYNPSASKDSGKITAREYFWFHCTGITGDLSDLVHGEKHL